MKITKENGHMSHFMGINSPFWHRMIMHLRGKYILFIEVLLIEEVVALDCIFYALAFKDQLNL